MKITRTAFLDKLRRASEMEEIMAKALVDLTVPEIFSAELTPEKRDKALKILLRIKKDTARHKEIVSGIMKKYSGE